MKNNKRVILAAVCASGLLSVAGVATSSESVRSAEASGLSAEFEVAAREEGLTFAGEALHQVLAGGLSARNVASPLRFSLVSPTGTKGTAARDGFRRTLEASSTAKFGIPEPVLPAGPGWDGAETTTVGCGYIRNLGGQAQLVQTEFKWEWRRYDSNGDGRIDRSDDGEWVLTAAGMTEWPPGVVEFCG